MREIPLLGYYYFFQITWKTKSPKNTFAGINPSDDQSRGEAEASKPFVRKSPPEVTSKGNASNLKARFEQGAGDVSRFSLTKLVFTYKGRFSEKFIRIARYPREFLRLPTIYRLRERNLVYFQTESKIAAERERRAREDAEQREREMKAKNTAAFEPPEPLAKHPSQMANRGGGI